MYIGNDYQIWTTRVGYLDDKHWEASTTLQHGYMQHSLQYT